jgi:hypothetical protein
MTDDEYIAFLRALARKHLGFRRPEDGAADLLFEVGRLRRELAELSALVRRMKAFADGLDSESATSSFIEELLSGRSPIERAVGALERSGILAALEDGGVVVLSGLRRKAIPEDDIAFLREAGFTDDEIEIQIAIAIQMAPTLVASWENQIRFFADNPKSFEEMVRRLEAPPSSLGAPKRRKIFNGIGKILGGSIAGIGNALVAVGTILAPNPATVYGAIASGGLAVSGICAGIGDLRGE